MGIQMSAQAQAAKPKTELEKRDSIYQANIKKTRIHNVYIPKDLTEAFKELDALSDEKSKLKFKLGEEEMVAKKLHFGLGRWISYNWNFDEGSRFVHYLRGLGLVYPDDMVNFTLISYHRYLNQKPLDVEARVKVYQEKRKKEKEERLKNAEVLSEETVKKGNE